MFKALKTNLLSVEPGRIIKVFPTSNVTVESEPLSQIKFIDKGKDCVVVSFVSCPNNTMTDHALDESTSVDLFLSLIGALCAIGNPVALTLRDRLPQSLEDIPAEYR